MMDNPENINVTEQLNRINLEHERCADISDVAANYADEAVSRKLIENSLKVKSIRTDNPSGKCLYCGESTGTDKRWCDFDHMKEWTRENE
jgi:hypothetical protein